MAAPFAQDDHRNGYVSNTALTLLLTFVITGGAWAIFSILQITATEQAVMGLLQINMKISPGMTTADALAFVQGSLDHNQQIANAIGWGVQIALYMVAFPSASTFTYIHQKVTKNRPISVSSQRTALIMARFRMILIVALVAGDIITDFVYVVADHTIFPMNGGILLVGLMFPAVTCLVNIFCGKIAISSLESLIDTLRGR